MSLKKQFNINSALENKTLTFLNEASLFNSNKVVNANYSSHLPEVYSGAPNRVERYNQFDSMELDSHISASLDIISEFCSQTDPVSKLPFQIQWNDTPTDSETDVITKMLRIWSNLNDFENTLFDMFRDTLKYGDQFFIRDPETYQWLRIYHGNVEKVIVNESKGKVPEQYVVRDLDLNLQNLTVTQLPNTAQGILPSVPSATYNNTTQNTRNAQYGTSKSRFNSAPGAMAVDANHIVHVNMTKRGDPNWPFGTSILEKVFKSYKQKELLEDAILIYRLQRAPMRRIFYVDVGDLSEHKAMQFIEQVKNSVSQRRIPSKTGGGQNMLDAAYNPLSLLDDFYFPQRADGRGSKIDTLPGGDTSWGIDELQYFDNKLARGLRIPSSYLPTGPEDSPSTYNDGKVGMALIQEYRFSEMCKRVQRSIVKKFDEEFKLYLKKRDINISSNNFSLQFVEPQSFITWRQIEIDTSRINNFNSVSQQPYFSKRWAMQRFLGLSADEINENHEMLMEENPSKFKNVTAVNDITSGSTPVDLRNIGFSQNDFSDDVDMNDQELDMNQQPSVDTGVETDIPTDQSTQSGSPQPPIE